MSRQRLLLPVICLMLVTLLTIGCGLLQASPTLAPTSTPTPIPPTVTPTPVPPTVTPAPTPTPTPGIGSVVTFGIWEVQVVSIGKESTLKGWMKGQSWSAKPGYSFLIVETLITNVSGEAQAFTSLSGTLTDSQGDTYSSTGLETKEGSGSYNLGPGVVETYVPSAFKSMIGIVFVVPNSAEGFSFQFEYLPAIDLGQ